LIDTTQFFHLCNPAAHLIRLRAVSKDNLKVELQPVSPGQRAGVHASACRGQGNPVHGPALQF